MNRKNRKWTIFTICVIITIVIVRSMVISPYVISSDDMNPTFIKGERIFVKKMSHNITIPIISKNFVIKKPQRNEVLIFKKRMKDNSCVHLMGKCIATSGDTIVLDRDLNISIYDREKEYLIKDTFIIDRNKAEQLQTLLDSLDMTNCQIAIYQNQNKYSLQTNDSLFETNDSILCVSLNKREYQAIVEANDTTLKANEWNNININDRKQIVIPTKNKPIKVSEWNIGLLKTALEKYEGKKAEIKDKKLYVDGRYTKFCIFSKNYLWLKAENTKEGNKAMYYEFIPHEEIIGKPYLKWYSKEKGKIFLQKI